MASRVSEDVSSMNSARPPSASQRITACSSTSGIGWRGAAITSSEASSGTLPAPASMSDSTR